MTTYFDVFNIKTDMQLNNIMNNLDLSANEMFQLDDIVNDFSSLKEKREKILEMFSGTNNYNYCRKLFLKEDMETPSQLNMNQTIELNELFELASEKFKKVNCSQQFYQMLSQKTSKNFANAFFNMLKSIPEDSTCRFDPNLSIDGKNFAETIYPFVNELKTFLNGCKSESKKEVKENYEIGSKVQGKGKNQGTYIIDSIKDGFYNLRNVYDQNRNKLYPVSKKTLDEEFKLLNESIETQPDMFGGRDTYYKDGIEALDFDNVLNAMNKVAPEMDFVDDRDVKGKYSMIFQPKSSGLELNQKGLKKIKDYLSQKFGKENISVRLAHSQYAPEIKKLYITFINQIDVQNELNESLEDTLNNFKYYITSSSDKDQLNMMKDKLEILFNGANDTELRNTISELLSMINSKLNTIKPNIDECCELGNLLEPFKTTVVNITVNDEGCLEDVEKESATNNLKALASHINDKKDCCEENNIENMQTIMSLISSLASFFQKRLCESQVIEKNPYKGDTLADQAKASMWRPSEEELEEDEELDEDTVYDHSWYEVKGQKYPKRTKNGVEINEMCSGGATCAASVGTIPSPAKPKSPKKKHKKSKVDEMALNMFKRHIIEDVNSQIDANGNHYEYRDGYFYINGDIARTKSKYQMLESLDENIELETLPGFNSEEMRLLEDIEASGSVGNEDDNNQNNNSNNNNNADNNNNQQNTNQNINQDNLGDVEQNVTQDNDLTPQQRQLKKDTEQVLDQSMNSGSDTEVSVNQGLDNNNDQASNTQTSSNNVKYKVIGKDDSDSNNIKYIIQDPNSKETMVVDATKLRLEK